LKANSIAAVYYRHLGGIFKSSKNLLARKQLGC